MRRFPLLTHTGIIIIVFGVGDRIGWPVVEGWIMKEACHYDEMKTRFSDEWVLVGDPETDENL